MFCAGCGHENEDTAKLCIKCGKEIKALPVLNSNQFQVRKKRLKILLFVLLLEIVGATFFCMGRSINLTPEIDSHPLPLFYLIRDAQKKYKDMYQSYGNFEELYKSGFLKKEDMNKNKGVYIFSCVVTKTTYAVIADPLDPYTMPAYIMEEWGFVGTKRPGNSCFSYSD